jgi:WD40 repeat protein
LAGDNSSAIEKLNCPDCRIKDIESNRLIAMSDSGNLSIVDLNRQVKTVEAKADKLDWLNSHSLIYYNDYEIYLYDFSNDGPELITRLGSPITSAVWHPNGRHLVFSSDNKIKIIELDNRELRNIIDIASVSASNLVVDRSGNNLYYSTPKGINKLNLQ